MLKARIAFTLSPSTATVVAAVTAMSSFCSQHSNVLFDRANQNVLEVTVECVATLGPNANNKCFPI